jgi:tetratricopeptide (TPR) repeat protein
VQFGAFLHSLKNLYFVKDSNKSNMDIYIFGELLATFRKQHHISQNDLAARLDVHRNTIGKWERGIGLPESKTIVLELAKQLRLNEQETRQLLEASLTAVSSYWNIPYQRNPFFTGREEILHHLHSVLLTEKTVTITQSHALSGLGGIGKTQMAIEYAYQHAPEYAAVFWIGADTYETLTASFISIAELLNLSEKQEQDQSKVVAAVLRWLNSHLEWLLIYDNVEDIEMVKRFLPNSRSGAILLTTRIHALGTLAQTIEVMQMSQQEGINFLSRRAKLLNSETSSTLLSAAESESVKTIVELMDGLPLALDQAGSYIEATKCSLSEYQRLFQSAGLRLLDERDAYADHPSSVARTFALAFAQLKKNNLAAADLLTVCAFLAPEAIPETFFIEGAVYLGPTFETLVADPLQFNAAIKVLLTYSLIQRNSTTQTLTVHRLVQVVLKEGISLREQKEWNLRALAAINTVFPEGKDVSSWYQCERLVVHVFQCVNYTESWEQASEEIATLLFKTGQYLIERGRYAEAELLLKRSVWTWEQLQGSEHILVVPSITMLGRVYYRQGKYKDADPLLRKALEIRERVQGMAHPDLAYLLNMQGNVYRDQARYEEAEAAYRRSIQIGKQKQGTEYIDLASPLNGLGNVYMSQERYEEAEAAYQQSIQIEEQEYGTEYIGLAHQLSNLARIYLEQGKYEETERLLKRALHIREQVLGKEHPLVAYPLNGLGDLYYDQGRYEDAESLLKDAMRIWEQASGEMYPNLAYPLCTLGSIYQKRGNYGEAERLYLRAVNIREQQLGKEHPDLVASLTMLGSVYCEQDRYEEAEPVLQRSLFLCHQYLSPLHPEFAETLYQLAHFYQVQQQTTQALTFYQQALTIYEQVLGLQHPKTNTTRITYIHFLRELGRVEEAVMVEAQVRV